MDKILIIVIFLFAFCKPNLIMSQNRTEKFVVCLDAGHGGKDPGRPTKYGYKEKDIALKIILAVGKKLTLNKDVSVIYTRDKDVFIDLFKRGKIANDADADLFVSVHCNAHNSQATGTETYVLGIHRNKTNFEVAKAENEVIYLEDNYEKHYEGFDPNSPESVIGLTLVQEDYLDQSIQIAKNVQDAFTVKLKRKNRGVKQAGFIVLHQTYMPSILIETGFITNKKEGDYLNSKKGQDEISNAIVNSILQYKTQLDENTGVVEYQQKELINPSNDSRKYFKIKIATSSRKIETASYNFKGLKNISVEKSGNYYKYYYNKCSNKEEANKLLEEAKDKGYKDAFIVTFNN